MYKLQAYTNEKTGQKEIVGVYKQDGDVTLNIPFDPANTDYQQFKKDITNGVALQDATGTAITDITTFLGTLP